MSPNGTLSVNEREYFLCGVVARPLLNGYTMYEFTRVYQAFADLSTGGFYYVQKKQVKLARIVVFQDNLEKEQSA